MGKLIKLIVFGVSMMAVGIGIGAAVLTIGGVADLVRAGQEMIWTLIILIGFLAVILARTLLIKSKFSGGLAVVFFFVISAAIEGVYELIYRIPALAGLRILEWNIWDTLFYTVICLILFGVSGVLADRKLSV